MAYRDIEHSAGQQQSPEVDVAELSPDQQAQYQQAKEQKEEAITLAMNDIDTELGWMKHLFHFSVDVKILKAMLIAGELTGNEEEDKQLIKQKFFPDQEFSFGNMFGRLGGKVRGLSYSIVSMFNELMPLLVQKQEKIAEAISKFEQEIATLKESIEEDIQGENNDGGNENEEGAQQDEDNPGQADQNDEQIQQEEQEEQDENEQETPDPTEDDEQIGAVGAGVTAATISTLGGFGIDRIRKMRLSKNAENLKWKAMIDDEIVKYEKYLERKGFEGADTKQKRLIQNNIEYLKKGKEDILKLGDNQALTAFQDLRKSKILSVAEFNKLGNVDPKIASQLDLIAGDAKKLSKLQTLIKNNDDAGIKTLLGMKSTDTVSADLLQIIKRAGSVDEGATIALRQTAKVFKHIKLIKAGGAFFRRLPLLDMAFLGIDVWQFYGEKEEAERIAQRNQQRAEILHDRARARMRTGLIGGGVEIAAAIIAGSVMGGPIGIAVGVGIGATVQTIQYMQDSLYYDIESFYAQRTGDFVNDAITTQINQAILAASQGKNDEVEKAINETLFVEVDHNDAQAVMKAGFEALLIRQNNFHRDNDKKEIIGEYGQEFVAQRMEYITQRMNEASMQQQFVSGNLSTANRIIREAEWYVKMQEDTDYTGTKEPSFEAISTYKESVEKNLLEGEHKENYQFLKDMATISDDPEADPVQEEMEQLHFFEMYHVAQNLSRDEDEEPQYTNKKLLTQVYDIVTFGCADTYLPQITTTFNAQAQKDVEEFLEQSTFTRTLRTSPTVYSSAELFENFTGGLTDKFDSLSLTDISDDPAQNMMYDLAKTTHGYDGENTLEDVVGFYAQSEKNDALGIYYGGNDMGFGEEQRMINYDRAINPKFSPQEVIEQIQQGEKTETIIEGMMDSSGFTKFLDIMQRMSGNFGVLALREGLWKPFLQEDGAGIDTATETPDDAINAYFRANMAKVIEQQRRYLQHKKKYKKEIVSYIQEKATDGYITLPYHLQVASKRSGLGDPRHCFFTYKDVNGDGNMEVVACTTEDNQGVHLGFIDRKEVLPTVYSKLDASEQTTRDEQMSEYTDMVDASADQLRDLVSEGNGSGEDELDMPREYEEMISHKLQERTDFKYSIKNYDLPTARKKMSDHYLQFRHRFERLYIQILNGIENNMMSNDQDTAGNLNVLLQISHKDIIARDEEKEFTIIDIQTKGEEDDMPETAQRFYDVIDQQEVENADGDMVDLQTLAREGDTVKALWYAELVRKSILQVETLSLEETEDGGVRIENTSSPIVKKLEKYGGFGGTFSALFGPIGRIPAIGSAFVGLNQKEKFETTKKELVTSMIQHNFEDMKYDDPVKTDAFDDLIENKDIDFSSEDITLLDPSDQQLAETGEGITEEIESTNPDYERGEERGEPKVFVTDPPKVESYQTQTLLADVASILGKSMDEVKEMTKEEMKELAFVGNLVNFCKYHFMGKGDSNKPFEITTLSGNIEFDVAGSFNLDTTILDISAHEDKYPSLYADREKREKLVKYLNNLNGWEADG